MRAERRLRRLGRSEHEACVTQRLKARPHSQAVRRVQRLDNRRRDAKLCHTHTPRTAAAHKMGTFARPTCARASSRRAGARAAASARGFIARREPPPRCVAAAGGGVTSAPRSKLQMRDASWMTMCAWSIGRRSRTPPFLMTCGRRGREGAVGVRTSSRHRRRDQ
eukprot:1521432-Prymnesium_polylepis.1